MTQLGIDVFIKEQKWKNRLENRRAGFLGHTASTAQNLQSSLQLIVKNTPLKISCVLGPQHGFQAVEQANMITTAHTQSRLAALTPAVYPHLKINGAPPLPKQTADKEIPVFSLYNSSTRRLTKQQLSYFDVLLVDLQDIGCRVYTYLTTLFYVLEDCCKAQKEVWILDRPNPAGRAVEGSILKIQSFVGAGPLPMRHGMTLAELAKWHCDSKQLTRALNQNNSWLTIIKMKNYKPHVQPWPKGWAFVPPSPNIGDTETARCYSGCVLLEGTHVSEGRGTVFPLKIFGFPNMDVKAVMNRMHRKAPQWLKGCVLREEHFKPVFDKFKNQLCSGIRIYASGSFYDENLFRPYRLVSLFLKCVLEVHADFKLWRAPPYEYEDKHPPIDILSGDEFLRQWIEDPQARPQDLENKLHTDELIWAKERKPFLLY